MRIRKAVLFFFLFLLTSHVSRLTSWADHDIPVKVVIGGPASISAGNCQSYYVEARNSTDMSVVLSNSAAVNLEDGNPGDDGNFYDDSDTTCSGSVISQVTIPSGYSNKYLRYKKASAGSVTLRAFAPFGGRVFLIGGSNSGGVYQDKNQEFDPVINSWVQRAPMPSARSFSPASAVVNGRIYVIGGYNGAYLNDNKVFDPAANAWITRAPMPTPRQNAGAAAVNGKVYVLGGYNANGNSGLNNNEEFDPAANAWATRAPIPVWSYAPAVAAVNGGIYVMGGLPSSSLNKTHAYDPAGNSWTSKANMSEGREGAASAVVGANIFVIGGKNGSASILNVVQRYDPSVDAWVYFNSMPTPRAYLGAAAVNGKIYAVGGYNGSTLGINEEFDPGMNLWYSRQPAPESVLYAAAAAGPSWGTLSVSVSASPTQLSVSGPNSVPISVCSPAFTVNSKDANGFLANVTTSENVNLTDNGAGGTFYSDPACATSVSQITIYTAYNQADFYYKNSSLGTVTINATSTNLLGGTKTVSVTGPTQLSIVGPSTTTVNYCTQYQVTSKDNGGTPSPVASATPISLSGGGFGGKFYDISSCAGGGITQVSIAASTHTAVFYFWKSAGGDVTLNADDGAGGLTAANKAVEVTGLQRFEITGSTSISSGQCYAYTVKTKNKNGAEESVITAASVNLSSGGAGGTFHSAAGCTGGSQTSSISIAASTSSAIFYYTKNAAGTESLTADDGTDGLMPGILQVDIKGATRLAITGPASPSTDACSLYTVNSRNDQNVNTFVSSDTVINLADSDANAGTFHSDAACITGISQVTIYSQTLSNTFYYKRTTAGSVTLTASAGGLNQGNLVINIGAVPSQLVLSGPGTISLGQCESYSVVTKDSSNNLADVSAYTTVSLSDGSSGGTFYTSPTCSAGSVSSVDISAGSHEASFYYIKYGGGGVTLTASASGLTSANKSVGILQPSQLEISGSTNPAPSSCQYYTVMTKSAGGAPAAVSISTTVTLSDGGSGGTFYSDGSCAASITTVLIAASYNSASFFYRKNSGGVATLTASALGLTSGNLAVTFGGPTKLVLSGPANLQTNACSSQYTVNTRSDSDINTNVVTGVSINLNDGGAGGLFYSDYLCTYSYSQFSIPAAYNAAYFYYKKSAAGSVVFTASAPGTNLTQSTLNVDVAAPVGATKLSITGPTSITAGNCAAYTATALDNSNSTAPVNGNAVLYMGDGGYGGTFYSDSSCAASNTSVTISSGSYLASFYYKKNYGGGVNLFIDDGAAGLAAGNLWVDVSAGSGGGGTVTQFSLTGPTYISANTCNSYTVNTQDSSGSITNVAAAQSVNLDGGGADGIFYSDIACATSLSSPVQLSIPAAYNSVTFSYRKTTGGVNVNLKAFAAGISTATLAVTVTSGGGGGGGGGGSQPTRFSIQGPTSIPAGSCSSAFNVNSQDSAFINANVGANTTVFLDDSGAGGTFYSDYLCAASISNITIYSGYNTASFYYKKSISGGVTLKADDGAAGLTEGTLAVSITGGGGGGGGTNAPTYISLSGPISVSAGSCSSAYTVQARDNLGNPANVTTAVSVSLSDGGLGGTFYSDPACAASLTQTSIAAALNSASFYYKKAASGSGYLDASASGLGTASMYVTVDSGGGTTADTFAPGQITDLSAQTGSEGVVILQWTSPGDDGFYGTASNYVIKFSTAGPITSSNWYDLSSRNITEFSLIAPAPLYSGSQQNFTVTGLSSGFTYWWAVRAEDEVFNQGLISNSPSASSGQSSTASSGDGNGTASIAPANAPGCQALTTTMTFTVDAASITSGGGIAVRVPDNWSWPQTYCQTCGGYVQALDASGVVHSSVTMVTNPENLGSQWFGVQVIAGSRLSAGEVLRLVYRDGWPQWQLANNVVFETRVKGSSSGSMKKISSQPSVNVVGGAAARVSFAAYDTLTLGSGQVSPAIALRSEDFCGNTAPAASDITVNLAGKKWNNTTYVQETDANASFASDAAFASPITQVTIPSGQSQSSFYYKTTTMGSTQIEASYLISGAFTYPSYRYVTVISGSVGFSNLSVDNGTPGSQTSATITPNGDGSADFATINFQPSDPSIQWRVRISSDNFSTTVYERYGSGSPYRSVAWDGKNFRNNQVVPNGTYTVRIDAGGDLGANTSLSVTVQSAFITGTVTLDGTPLEGAMVTASGWPMAYGSPSYTDAAGTYKVYGLKAGSIYSVSVSRTDPVTFRSVSGSANNITASNSGATANVALGSPSRIRVQARLPVPAVYDLYGSVEAKNAAANRFNYGGVHFSPGSLISDAGGYSYGAQFSASASTWTSMDVTADTYTVKLDVYGYSPVEKQVFVGAGQTKDVSFVLSKRANIYGVVILPALSSYGTWVSVEGTKSGDSFPTQWGGAWIPPSKSSAVYTLFGVSSGTYNLRAVAPGYSSASTGPVTVASIDLGNPDSGGVDFPVFGTGASIQGTVRVMGNSTLLPYGGSRPNPFQVYINAFNSLSYIGSYDSPSLNTSLTESSAPYSVKGLDAGASYQLTAFLDGFELDPPGPRNVSVPSSGTAVMDLVFRRIDAQFKLSFLLPSGRSDYDRISVHVNGPGILNPVIVDVTQPPVGSFSLNSSSAAYLSPLINNGFYTVSAFYHTDGISKSQTVQAASGKVSEAVFDFSDASSFILGGTVTLNSSLTFNFSSFTVTVSSMAGVVANAGFSRIATSTGALISTSAARMEAFLEDADNFGKVGAGSVSFDSEGNLSISRSWSFGRVFYGMIREDGSYQMRVPPGVYRVKPHANLDGNLANGLEVAPQEKVVVVKNAAVTGVDFILSPGVLVSGTLRLPAGVTDNRPIGLVLSNTRGEPVGFTVARLVNSNSASFEFTRVADGDYLIVVEDAGGGGKAYGAKPKKITVTGTALSNQDIQMVPIGSIRGSLLVERVKADGTKIRTPITVNNKNLLPKGFRVVAQANPWFEGGVFEATREGLSLLLDANNQFVIENMIAGIYDVKFRNEDASYDTLVEGSLNLAPRTVSGTRLSQGQSADLGTVVLQPALAVTGVCKDTAGNPLANILVGAVPAQGSHEDKEALRHAVLTNAQGIFTLPGLSSDIRYYDFFAQPRGGAWNKFLKGKELAAYAMAEKRSVDVTAAAGASLDFSLESASASIRGRVDRPGAGKSLSYPTGALSGFPAAAIYLQRDGVQPKDNPLGDISFVTDADDGTGASFQTSGLSPGKYRLTAVSLGYASTATVITAATGNIHIGTLTFSTGGSLTGKIAKADGTAPSSDEIRFIGAVSGKFDSVVFGVLTAEEQTKTITGYSFSGFTPGTTYSMIIQGSDGIVATPEEAKNIHFNSASEEQTLNVTWKLPRPQVFGRFKRESNGSYTLKFQATQALRKRTTADDDLTQIITVESGSGALSSLEMSNDRRQMSAVYTPGTGETTFRIRILARTTIADPEATDPDDPEFTLSTVFNYQVGLDSYGESTVNNLDGGTVGIEGDSAQMELQPGSLTVDVSSNVRVTMAKTDEKPKPAGALRFAPQAYTPGLLKAMAASPDVSALSAFYEILLPRGLSSRLAKAGTLTLSYSSTSVADPTALNIYWFNEGANAYFIQNANKTVDTVNNTISINVDHLSTFVVLSASQEIIKGNAFAGGEVEVFNFPNPFNLKSKTLSLNRATAGSSMTTDGTVIRFTLPTAITGAVLIDIYNIAGEHVRRIDAGERSGGNYYYVDWDGRNDSGREVASGVYIGELRVAGQKKFFKMAVIK